MIGRNFVKFGRIFGIETGLSLNWFIMFAIAVYVSTPQTAQALAVSDAAAGLITIVAILLVYASILAHEFGHALTARAFGIETRRITLHLFGGVAMLDGEPARPREEFWITVAGPGVSFVLGGMFGLAWVAGHGAGIAGPFTFVTGCVAVMNVFIAVFNCLPGFPMDGGRIVRSAIWAATDDYLLATRIASWGGFGVAALLLLWAVAAIAGGDFTAGAIRVLFAVFLVSLARQSYRQAVVMAPFRDKKVRDFMRPIRAVVSSGTLVSDVVADYLRPMQIDQLPVIDGDKLLGCVSVRDIESHEPRQWAWIRAAEVMKPYAPHNIIDPDEDAVKALHRFGRNGQHSFAVFKGRQLLGHIVDRDFARHMQAANARPAFRG